MSNEVFTRDASKDVASGLQYFIQHPDDNRHFLLHLVRYKRRSGADLPTREEFTVAVRLIDELPNLIPRAGGGQMVRCITNEGKRVDILLSQPGERVFDHATVDIEE